MIAQTNVTEPTQTKNANIERMGKGHGVADVIRFGDSPGRVLVHQDDFTPHALHQQSVAGGGAHEPATDDAHFHIYPRCSPRRVPSSLWVRPHPLPALHEAQQQG